MDTNKKEVAEAIASSFEKKQLYPSLTVGGLRRTLALLGPEYDDNVVTFGFLLKDMGDSGKQDGMKNFVLGTIPIKCLVRHPDETKVVVCDDASTDYFINYTNAGRTGVRND